MLNQAPSRVQKQLQSYVFTRNVCVPLVQRQQERGGGLGGITKDM